MRIGIRRTAVASLGVALMVAGLAPSGASAGTPGPSPSGKFRHVVVVSGLNNPRQLSLVGNKLLIAEAGRGGPIVIGEGDEAAYVGDTGSISQVLRPATVRNSGPHRIVTGLISGAGPDGSFATGSDGVSFRAPKAPIFIAETYAPPDVLPEPIDSAQSGKLLRVKQGRTGIHIAADITQYEIDNDPDGHGIDSNPYAVLATPRGEYVADAAGNDVLFVDRHNNVSLFHVFANITTGDCAEQFDPDPGHPGCNFVPTSLARGAGGHVYVGGLASEVPGEGQVVELDRSGNVVQTWPGFTTVTGVAVGTDHTLYVSQFEADTGSPFPGALTRVAPDGTRTDAPVPFPAGVAVDASNRVYVSAWSGSTSDGSFGPGTDGQVWRMRF